MVNRIELPGHPAVYTDKESNKKPSGISRRGLMLGVAGLGATVGVAGISRFATSGEKSNSVESGGNHYSNKSITIEESQARISALTQDPEIFSDGISPSILTELDYEGLVDIGGVLITEANRSSNSVWVRDYLRKHLLFLRAGGTKKDLLLEMEKGIQIGVRNDDGLLVADLKSSQKPESHGEFVNRTFGVPMLQGMGPDTIGGASTVSAKEALLYQQKRAADWFVGGATKIDANDSSLDSTVYIPFYNVQDLAVEEGPLFRSLKSIDMKRVKIDFQVEKKSASNVVTDDMTTTLTYIEDRDTEKYLVVFEHTGRQEEVSPVYAYKLDNK